MTDIINLENLHYPMFETTEEEKEELREVLKIYPNAYSGAWLCQYVGNSLQIKIGESLIATDHAFISSYIYDQIQSDSLGIGYETFLELYKYEVRIVWINKLIDYEGE
jgi:hypothetical protein